MGGSLFGANGGWPNRIEWSDKHGMWSFVRVFVILRRPRMSSETVSDSFPRAAFEALNPVQDTLVLLPERADRVPLWNFFRRKNTVLRGKSLAHS